MRTGTKVVQSKPTTVDGIDFSSTLEATMYKLLRDNGIPADYEPRAYRIFPAEKYEGECWERATKKSPAMIDRRSVTKIDYTPDFVCPNEDFFIECKGRANESFPLRWKMFKSYLGTWANRPLPMIFKPMNKVDCEQVIKILKSKGCGR